MAIVILIFTSVICMHSHNYYHGINYYYVESTSLRINQSAVVVISVVSSSSVLLILLFFILGFICGYYFKQKYAKDKTSDSVSENQAELNSSTALYEDILPNTTQKNLEMEQNTAYGL